MKIALVSCYFIDNYGSILQSYATQQYFKSKGVTCHTVAVEKIRPLLKKAKLRYYLRNAWDCGLLRSKLPMVKLSVLEKIGLHKIGNARKERHNRFEAFRQRLAYTQAASSFEELRRISQEYDGVVLGSDQLWRPDNIFPGYYTLEWVSPKTKRLSLATSFGVSQLDRYSQKRARDFLRRFSAISVREAEGAAIVQTATGQTAAVVCDPVLLLEAEEWNALADTGLCPDRDYIFAYFLGNSKKHRAFVKDLSVRTGLPVVTVPFVDCYCKEDAKAAFCFPEAGPEQFLGLLRNAKYVCTDSFHASAFSVLFEKQFFVFDRFHTKRGNTNSRIHSFLRELEIEPGDTAIDYSTIDRRLVQLKRRTEQFIETEILENIWGNDR